MKNLASSWFVRGTWLLLSLRLFVPANAAELWVSPDGSDTNSGTRDKPLVSVAGALRQARDLRRLGKIATNEPAQIFLRGGIYPLVSPLRLRPEDSETASSPTIIEAAHGRVPRVERRR